MHRDMLLDGVQKGNNMSNREIAMELLEQVPEEKLYYIIGVIEGALIPDSSEYDDEIDKAIEQSEKEIAEGAELIDIEEAFARLEAKHFG